MNRSTFCHAAMPVLFLSGAVAGRAEVTDCTAITAVPTTISSAGVYCLTGNMNLGGTGVAVHILGAKDVVLDLNGHALIGPANGTAVLVEDASRVTVRNGSIAAFRRAVYVLPNSYNARIEDLLIQVTGELPAIESQGWGDIIQRNWIERGNPVIRTAGGASRVSDNDVFNAMSGIDMTGSGGFVEDNRVKSLANGTGYGIRASGGRMFLSRNAVTSFSTCFDMSATTRYRDNVTSGCAFPYSGGSSAGGNY